MQALGVLSRAPLLSGRVGERSDLLRWHLDVIPRSERVVFPQLQSLEESFSSCCDLACISSFWGHVSLSSEGLGWENVERF